MSDTNTDISPCTAFRDKLNLLINALIKVYDDANPEDTSPLKTIISNSEPSLACVVGVYIDPSGAVLKLRFTQDEPIINLMLFHNYAIEIINLIHNPDKLENTKEVLDNRYKTMTKKLESS